MWEFDHKEGKNSCFQTVVLEKTLESYLDSQEIKPVSPKGNPLNIHWTKAPIPPDGKSWLIGKDPDAGKDWGQEKGATKDKMVGYWVTDSIGVSLSKLWELVKDREAWHDAVYGVAKNWTRLSDWITVSINSNIGTCRSVFVASFFPSFLGHLTFWWGAAKKTKQNNDLLRKLVWRKLGN